MEIFYRTDHHENAVSPTTATYSTGIHITKEIPVSKKILNYFHNKSWKDYKNNRVCSELNFIWSLLFEVELFKL